MVKKRRSMHINLLGMVKKRLNVHSKHIKLKQIKLHIYRVVVLYEFFVGRSVKSNWE